MKIISKHKDYYDYLQGIYGVDEKLILDRTKFHQLGFRQYEKIIIVIGELVVEGLSVNDTFVYGEDIKPFAHKPTTWKWGRKGETHHHNNHDEFYSIDLPKEFSYYRNLNILKDKSTREKYFDEKTRKKLDKHSLFILSEKQHSGYDVYEFPILKDYVLASFITPEEVWFKLSDWLSRDIKVEDKRTNEEKIVGKGFDLKTSFRKM